jgi:BirA family biotin operon repressor/biotin-[acetyl-CoA-carboxylase] ligase
MEDISLDTLSEQTIRGGLGTRFVGQHVVHRASVGSTNDLGRELAEQGADEGTLVIAEEQTAGRGRRGRAWLAPPGTSLLMSLILRPRLPHDKVPQLTMISGLAVQQAIVETTGLVARLKWPNDVLVRGSKVGGILTEASSLGQVVQYVVLGMGVNVNLAPKDLPAAFSATSIAHELGRAVPRLPLLQRVLEHLEARYLGLGRGTSPLDDWSAALETLGKSVLVSTSHGRYEGLATAVDQSGALLLRLPDGQTKRVLAGEVLSSEH